MPCRNGAITGSSPFGLYSSLFEVLILFTVPVSNLSMDYYVLINGVVATFEIFDSSHNSLGTFSDNALSGDKNATFNWGGTGIAELDFSGNTGVIGISTLTFETTSVPEPTSVLLSAMMLGVAFVARKRIAQATGTSH